MDRLFLFGQRDSLLPVTVAALFPECSILRLDPCDPFSALDEGPPALLLVEFQDADWQPAAVIAATRRLHPDAPIVALYSERRRRDATCALEAGADAVLAAPFGSREFVALLRRHLNRRPAAPEAALDSAPEASPEATAAPAREIVAPAEPRPTQPLAENRAHLENGHDNGNGSTKAATSATRMADLDALSVFVRGLAHEVNNPLTTIRGFLQLLLSDDSGRPADTAEAYRTMETESRRIAEVIQELEYFSGARRPARTIVDAVRLVRESLAELRMEHVKPLASHPTLPLLADREQFSLGLRHLFGYLESTAPDDTPPIRVTISREGGSLVVCASGRCSVAPSATPQHLLVPLYAGQATEGTRRSLACVFGIARAHGGAFEVARDTEGLLQLRLTLPVGEALATD